MTSPFRKREAVASFPTLLGEVVPPGLDYPHAALGLKRRRKPAWRRDGSLEIRVLRDTKANDPYAGGAFTLELEKSPDGRFQVGLSGRVLFDLLLDDGDRALMLEMHNAVVDSLMRPPPHHVDAYAEFLRPTYLKRFEWAANLPREAWMRFTIREHLETWTAFMRPRLPMAIRRLENLDVHTVYMGEHLSWTSGEVPTVE